MDLSTAETGVTCSYCGQVAGRPCRARSGRVTVTHTRRRRDWAALRAAKNRAAAGVWNENGPT